MRYKPLPKTTLLALQISYQSCLRYGRLFSTVSCAPHCKAYQLFPYFVLVLLSRYLLSFQLVTESSLVDSLTIDGEPIYHLAKCPEMLYIAKVILIDCASHFKEHPVSVRFYAHYVALSTVCLQNFACLWYVACLTPMFCFRRWFRISDSAFVDVTAGADLSKAVARAEPNIEVGGSCRN